MDARGSHDDLALAVGLSSRIDLGGLPLLPPRRRGLALRLCLIFLLSREKLPLPPDLSRPAHPLADPVAPLLLPPLAKQDAEQALAPADLAEHVEHGKVDPAAALPLGHRVVAEEEREQVGHGRELDQRREERRREKVVQLGGRRVGRGEERREVLECDEVQAVLGEVVRVLGRLLRRGYRLGAGATVSVPE